MYCNIGLGTREEQTSCAAQESSPLGLRQKGSNVSGLHFQPKRIIMHPFKVKVSL